MVDLRRLTRDENPPPEAQREWLVANGLGGYASATITGAITRRYHGFLIAALPPPLGRMVVLNDLEVDIEREDGSVVNLRENGRFLDFTLDMGLPSWRYEIDGVVIEKSIVVPSRPEHRALHLSPARRRRARPPAAQTLHQLSSARGAGQRGALLGLCADRPGQPIRDHRRAGSADIAAGGGGLRRPDVYRRWRLAPRVLLRDRSAARLRFARLAVEPRLFCRRSPQGSPADPDRCDRALAYRARR